METSIFFILFSFIFLPLEVLDANLTSMKCNQSQPVIHFPFAIRLFCKHNQTMISFPGYGDLVLKSISYDHTRLALLDPENCVPEVFLNLNLTLTPFRYYHDVKQYTYLNCSSRLSPSFQQVPCLSSSKYHVYVLESSLDVPISCKPMKTVSIPFSYSSYISDNSFGLELTWDSLDSACFKNCQAAERRRWFDFQSTGKASRMILFVIMIVGLVCAKTYCFKKSDSNKDRDDRLLGDGEALRLVDHTTFPSQSATFSLLKL